jgi:hypothetical protein
VSAGMACRAWRPVAQKLIHFRLTISWRNSKRAGRFLSGYRLNSFVFGSSSFQIATLSLNLSIGNTYFSALAQLVAPSLKTLNISCKMMSFRVCYKFLESFFSKCQWIRTLRVAWFKVGDDFAAIPQPVKEGFARLNQLDLIDFNGDARLFIESTSIPNLKSFKFNHISGQARHFNVIKALASKYGRTLINLDLGISKVSFSDRDTLVNCCTKLEKLTISLLSDQGVILYLSDLQVVASLPCLQRLEIDYRCSITVGAVSALAHCRELRHLEIDWQESMSEVFRVIGGRLISLSIRGMNNDAIDDIVAYCPNLKYLEVTDDSDEYEEELKVAQKLKN